MEIWKNIKGYDGIYKISNYGRVKNIKIYGHYHIRNNKIYKDYTYIHKYKQFRQNKVLKFISNTYGYLFVNLYKNNKSKMHTIHNLVAQHFIPNINNKEQINHIDGDKKNNHVSNLEWCTNSENIKHAYDNNLMNSDHIRKPIKIIKDDFNKTFNSITDGSKYLNCTVANLCTGVKKGKYKGYMVFYI